MRAIPVDTNELRLIASGMIAAKGLYAELADGSRRRVPGEQAKDRDTGLPLWVVDCFVDEEIDPDVDGRAEVVGVTVGSADRPRVTKFAPVTFVGLTATGYVRDNRVAFSFKADGIAAAAQAVRSA